MNNDLNSDKFTTSTKKVIRYPNVVVFEGGDVCGKSTQSILMEQKNKNSVRFKFPSQEIDIGNTEDIISNCPIVYNRIFKACEQKHGIKFQSKYNTYNIFNIISSRLFMNDPKLIVNSIDNIIEIEKIVCLNIIVNAIDKYNWIKNYYYKYYTKVNEPGNKDNKLIILDRFITSGKIYNSLVPIGFLEEIVNNYDELTEDKETQLMDSIRTINKYSYICNKILIELLYNINTDKIFPSEILFSDTYDFYKLFNDYYTAFDKFISHDLYTTHLYFNIPMNFKTYYFKPSKILYRKFLKEAENNSTNREVTKYDTNDHLRFYVNKYFDIFTVTDKNSTTVNTDIILNIYDRYYKSSQKSPEEVFYNIFLSNV